MPGLHRVDEAIQVGELRRIGLEARGVRADGGHGRVEFGLAPARDVDKGAFRREGLRGREADAGGAAGDDRHLAREFVAHVVLRWLRK